jgi:NAD+ synthase (glutamine-hydrolysing)
MLFLIIIYVDGDKHMRFLRLALAQINSTVGDLKGNSGKIREYIKKAKSQKADLVAFPELAITGYPPEDLIHKPQFIADNLSELNRLRSVIQGIVAVVGFIDIDDSGNMYNGAAVITQKRVIDVYHKVILPNYGVFDEHRYFKSGKRFPLYNLKDTKIGITICEDIWDTGGPIRTFSRAGAEFVVNINASPYERGKPQKREKILREWTSKNGVMIAYLNAVGGQDELVFDGFSMIFDHTGKLIARGKQFEEDLMIMDVDMSGFIKFKKSKGIGSRNGQRTPLQAIKKVAIPAFVHTDRKPLKSPAIEPLLGKEEEVYKALVLGTDDYTKKNGFRGVVVGLSGGIDSSLVATIAVDALGKENVTGLFMPSQFTSEESREDAHQLAETLEINIIEIPIDGIVEGYIRALQKEFSGKGVDTTEENLQARIRGNILMAFSNKFGWLVLTTGNKSEMSVGYATLYGDMAGGFAVIKDVPKTLVYDLCKWRNSSGENSVIPERILWKEPTAELKADQKDSDTLPPYEELDLIIKAYVEDEMSFREILKIGCELECTQKVISMIDGSEYKRRQAPPGIKITARAFGRDRRFPITNKYRSY